MQRSTNGTKGRVALQEGRPGLGKLLLPNNLTVGYLELGCPWLQPQHLRNSFGSALRRYIKKRNI